MVHFLQWNWRGLTRFFHAIGLRGTLYRNDRFSCENGKRGDERGEIPWDNDLMLQIIRQGGYSQSPTNNEEALDHYWI